MVTNANSVPNRKRKRRSYGHSSGKDHIPKGEEGPAQSREEPGVNCLALLWRGFMQRWRTVFRNDHKKVLVRGGGGGGSSNDGLAANLIFWGVVAVAAYVGILILMEIWPWLLVAVGIWAVFACMGGKK